MVLNGLIVTNLMQAKKLLNPGFFLHISVLMK